MKKPPNGIVNELALREGLVSTFMANDPDTRSPKSSEEAVQGPDGKATEAVQIWTGKLDVLGSNSRFKECCSLVSARKEKAVPDAVKVSLTILDFFFQFSPFA